MAIDFTEPDLVAIYDAVNPIEEYAAFYTGLAGKLKAKKIIDLGCGTGLLTHEFVKQGHTVIGIEPAVRMLERAKQKYGEEAEWVIGSSEALRTDMQADLAVMTGHVAQFFLEEDSWKQALHNICRSLKPGGYLAFESRNPLVKPFADWPTPSHHSHIPDTPLGPVERWPDNVHYADGYADYEINYLFTTLCNRLVSGNRLRFRSKQALVASLQDAGFTIEHIYGDWSGEPYIAESPEMIFVAKATGSDTIATK